MKNITYIAWQEDDQFVSQCLNFDIASCGSTAEEAIANLKEALDLLLEDRNSNSSEKMDYIPVNNIMIGQQEIA